MATSIYTSHNGKLTEVSTPSATLYFSYTTLVGFQTDETGRVVSENIWSQTTGKHLNAIDGGDKASRVSHDEFVKQATKAGLL